jgi:predicted dehydrogenase
VSHFATDYRETLAEADGAIITTPAHLHYDIARQCLAAGVHVLSEKPLAETAQEGRDLQADADRRGLHIAVNNTRRLMPVSAAIAALIQRGDLGTLQRIEFFEGDRFDWPSASGAMFGLGGNGRGVLQDWGAHVLDLICWWVGDKPEIADYADDSFGGSEAVAHISLEHDSCQIDVRLNWLAKQRNTVVIRGDRAEVEFGIYDLASYVMRTGSGGKRKVRIPSDVGSFGDIPAVLIDNFLAVVQHDVPPLVAARDVLPSIELIEDCYARRKRFDMPWHPSIQEVAHAAG